MTRELNIRETAALDLLLSADFPGANELREQAKSVRALNSGMVLDLVVSKDAASARVHDRLPVQADVDGEGYDGGLLLYVDRGRLTGLEYWWVTEEAPELFPPVKAIGAPIVKLKPPSGPRRLLRRR